MQTNGRAGWEILKADSLGHGEEGADGGQSSSPVSKTALGELGLGYILSCLHLQFPDLLPALHPGAGALLLWTRHST